MGDEYMDVAAVAADLGVKAESVRTYHKRATANRARAEREADPSAIKPGDMPAPDETLAGRPVWKKATIDAWKPRRPGQGAGGGRPWTDRGNS